MQYISMVQFIKFLVKIVRVYILMKRAGALTDLKPINWAKLKEDLI